MERTQRSGASELAPQDGRPSEVFDAIDALVAVTEHFLSLIVVPIIVCAITYLFLLARPATYESSAILKVSPEFSAAMMKSPVVLDRVAELLPAGTLEEPVRRSTLARMISVSAMRSIFPKGVGQTLAVKVQAFGNSPEQTSQVIGALIRAWVATQSPVGTQKEQLTSRLAFATDQLNGINGMIKSVDSSSLTTDSLAVLSKLMSMASTAWSEASDLRRSLYGPSEADIIVSSPSVPEEVERPWLIFLPLTGGLVAFIVIAAFWIARAAFVVALRRKSQSL